MILSGHPVRQNRLQIKVEGFTPKHLNVKHILELFLNFDAFVKGPED